MKLETYKVILNKIKKNLTEILHPFVAKFLIWEIAGDLSS